MKTIGSYFNPCSKHHDALTNFKGLSCLKQVGIGFVVTCLALSLFFAPFAVPVFRLLNERCQVQTNLDPTGTKTQNVYRSTQNPPSKTPPEPSTTTSKPTVASPPSNPVQTVQTSSTALSAPKNPEPAQPKKMIQLSARYKFKKGAIITSLKNNKAFLNESEINKIDGELSKNSTFGNVIHIKINIALYNSEKAMQKQFSSDPTILGLELIQTRRIREQRAESILKLLADCAELVAEDPE